MVKTVALRILKEHGFSPHDDTVTSGKKFIKFTSFYDIVGEKDYYTRKEVYDWLGY